MRNEYVIISVLIGIAVLLTPAISAASIEKNIDFYKKQNDDKQPPVADAGGPYVGKNFEWITVDGSGSYDPDGTIIGYRWILKGLVDTGWIKDPVTKIKISHRFRGFLTVTLMVKDSDGLMDSDTATLVLSKPLDSTGKTNLFPEMFF